MYYLLIAMACFGMNFFEGTLAGEAQTGIFSASTITWTYFEETDEIVTEAIINEEIFENESNEGYEEIIEELDESENIQTETISLNEHEEPVVEDILKENTEDIVERETEKVDKELTYDQLTQKGEKNIKPIPVPPEVADSWYVEETAMIGLEKIIATYGIQEFSFVIDTCPSNYVYQYEFYLDSPEGDHVNLIGMYQYDATGNRLFYLDPVSGIWQ